jgi:hypothetical protein
LTWTFPVGMPFGAHEHAPKAIVGKNKIMRVVGSI